MFMNQRNVTNGQLLLMLNTIESNPAMAHDSVLKTTGSTMYNGNWNELVENLNAEPNGAVRSVRCWQTVLKEWKAKVMTSTNNENMQNVGTLDHMSKRLLRLVQEEHGIVPDEDSVMSDIFVMDPDIENVFRRPQPRRSRRRPNNVVDQLEAQFLTERREKCLNTLLDDNYNADTTTRKRIMQMHLDRLYRVSQQLESHIQDVQNRIQTIKDRWQHDCDDE